MKIPTNVGNYVTQRLEQLGVNHIFSVPGDYTSDFLEIVDTQSTLHRIGNCNELNAGYAADGRRGYYYVFMQGAPPVVRADGKR